MWFMSFKIPKNATPAHVFWLLCPWHSAGKCPHTKCLGITIQSNLKWDVHCKQFAAKSTNTLNILKWNLKSTKEVCKKAYKSLVYPQVKYAAFVWYPSLARDKAQIERVQHGAAPCIHNTYSRYSSVTAMLQSLNWETLQSCRFNMCLCIIYKAHYNLATFPLLGYTYHSPNLGQ